MPAKIHAFVICFCLLSGPALFCQKIDSLKKVLEGKRGAARFGTLYNLVLEFSKRENFLKSLEYIQEAQVIAWQYNDSLHIVKAGRVKGQILRRLDRTADAIREFKKVASIAFRNDFKDEYEYILNGLALGYTLQASYDSALRFHFECLALRESRDNQDGKSRTLNNIGLVYYKLGNYEKALSYYGRSLKCSTDSSFKAELLINIGLCYNYLRDFEKAKKFINDGLELCSPECSKRTNMYGDYGLGISYLNIGQMVRAENHFHTSLALAKEENDKRYQIENLIMLARIYIGRGIDSSAAKFLTEAETLAMETSYNDLLINIYRKFLELYNLNKDFSNAALYQMKYIQLRDTVYDEELTKNLMRIQTEFDERENLAKIASQEQILTLNKEAIRRQWLLNILMGVVLLLFFCLVLILIKAYRDKQRVNVSLDKKVFERTKSLEDTLNSLNRSHAELEEFIIETSRDIQSPVSTIKGLSNVMLAESENPRATRESIKRLESVVSSLSHIQNRLSRKQRS